MKTFFLQLFICAVSLLFVVDGKESLANNSQKEVGFITNDTFLLASSIFSYYDTTGWFPSTQISYAYNERGERLETLWQYWEKGKLKNFKKIIYSFTDQNLLKTEFYQNWQNDRWENQSRYENSYNQRNKISRKEKHSWSYDSNSGLYYWMNNNVTEYFYNSDNFSSEVIYSERPSAELQKVSRNVYTYDSQGNPIIEQYQEWSDSTWKDNTKYTRKYIARGKLSSSVTSILIDSTWSDIASDSTVYNFDNDAIILFHNEVKNGQLIRTKDVRTFDSLKLNIRSQIFEWKDSLWSNSKQVAFKYDDSGYLMETLNQIWKDSIWQNQSKEEYNYWKVRTDAVEMASNLFEPEIYPIPAQNVVNIQLQIPARMDVTAELTDLNGNPILKRKYPTGISEIKLDIGNIPVGIYLLRITTCKEKYLCKIVKN